METCGFSESDWAAAKEEVKLILGDRVRQGFGPISYGELARQILVVEFHAHDPNLVELLRQVSMEEDLEGRGMLTAMVVLSETGRPGGGFFTLAGALGRNIEDRERCWVEEVARVVSAPRCGSGEGI